MFLLIAVRQEQLDFLAEQVGAREAEELLGLGVDENDVSLAVDDDDRVGSGLEQAPEFLLRLLAFADVADRAHHERAFLGLQRAQADFYGKLRAVLAHAVELQAHPHCAGPRLDEIVGAMADMRVPEALRQQHLDRLAFELSARVPEQILGLGVRVHDASREIDHHDAVGHGFQEIAEPRLDQFGIAHHPLVSDVLLARENELYFPLSIARRPGGDIDVDG